MCISEYTPTPPQNLHFEEKYCLRTYSSRRDASQVHFFQGPFLVLFMDNLSDNFWPQNGPQNGYKICPKNKEIASMIRHLLFEVLELYRCLLRAFLAPPRLFWMAFDFQKPLRTYGFSMFLQMQCFRSFEALDGLFGPISAALNPIWSPTWTPKSHKN